MRQADIQKARPAPLHGDWNNSCENSPPLLATLRSQSINAIPHFTDTPAPITISVVLGLTGRVPNGVPGLIA
jgi:hypothetical protein